MQIVSWMAPRRISVEAIDFASKAGMFRKCMFRSQKKCMGEKHIHGKNIFIRIPLDI